MSPDTNPLATAPAARFDADSAVARFCLAHPRAFLIPAEAFTASGVAPEFASLLLRNGRLSAPQLQCLNEGFALYWQRCQHLYASAPGSWFAPRVTNLLVAAEARDIAPYLEPFGGTSSMLYASDFDTHPEYVAFLLVHLERLSLLRHVPATVAYNLSYWFDRSQDSKNAFATAARRAQRPDAAGFVALAEAFEWLGELLHHPLRAPQQEVTEPLVHIDGADLYVPKRLQPRLMALTKAVETAVRDAMAAVPESKNRPKGPHTQALDDLCDWLQQSRAQVIIHGPHGGTLWTPAHDDPIRVRNVLAEANHEAIASILADLRVIDARSRQFLERVVDVNALPTHCAVLETGGGVYIDPAQRALVYELQQPAFDTRAGEAPPYHRLLLGARVMHEWGHVAHTAKILHLPEPQRAAYTAARTALGECFAGIVASAPGFAQDAIAEEMQSIEPSRTAWPKALARKTLARVGDYLANMMAVRLIPAEEMQAYVRNNVRHHQDEDLGLVSELARYAYEINYLDLVGLPRRYFYDTSRFPQHFIDTGIVSENDANALFDATRRVLSCYAIDESRLRLQR